MTQRMEGGSHKWARIIFGKEGREEVRLAQFLVSELPVAAVRQHLLRGEKPPELIDRIIRATYRAVVADYGREKRFACSTSQEGSIGNPLPTAMSRPTRPG